MLRVQAQNKCKTLFPKVLQPIDITLSTRPWLKRTPVIPDMLSVNHTSFLWYASQWMLNSIKAHWKRGLRTFSSERLVSLPSPSRSFLGSLILICGGWGALLDKAPPQVGYLGWLFYNLVVIPVWSWEEVGIASTYFSTILDFRWTAMSSQIIVICVGFFQSIKECWPSIWNRHDFFHGFPL